MKDLAVPPSHYQWLIERIGCTVTPEFKAIAAVDDAGRIHGMAGFDLWTENSVTINIALENPAALRTILRPIFNYAFVQAGRGVALATVREANVRSRELVEHVGFTEVYRVKDGIRVGEDMILYQMRREDCRWIAQRKAA